jgi:hypothetical protein
MLTPYAETIPRSFRLVMVPGPHIVITTTDHDQEQRSSAPCGPTRAEFSCGAVSQEWEGGPGGVTPGRLKSSALTMPVAGRTATMTSWRAKKSR